MDSFVLFKVETVIDKSRADPIPTTQEEENRPGLEKSPSKVTFSEEQDSNITNDNDSVRAGVNFAVWFPSIEARAEP